MKRFRNIVLLYECDDPTLERACTLAKNNNAQLTVIQVVKSMPIRWRQVRLGEKPIDLQELAIQEYQSRLEQFVLPLQQDGIQVVTKVLVGTPFLEIVRDVIHNQRDLVIMTAEGKGGVRGRLFGRTSLHLMRKCPCPVWVMKPNRRKLFPRILAAVDPDSGEKESEELNAMILQLASSLAAQDNAELHVIHAWTLLYKKLMQWRGGLSESEILRCALDEERVHRTALNTLLERHTDGQAIVHLVEGEADDVILQFTKEHNVDLLVMGTVCRTNTAGFFIGNTAEKILEEVDCSVLTVKPEGFVSPIEPA